MDVTHFSDIVIIATRAAEVRTLLYLTAAVARLMHMQIRRRNAYGSQSQVCRFVFSTAISQVRFTHFFPS